MAFEYNIIYTELPDDPDEECKKLDRFGRRGWELVSVVWYVRSNGEKRAVYYFKREV